MRLRFDRFELDTGRYELREDGQPRPVEPKVFDLLVLLATHPQRVFSRDELVERVWDARVVSDATVSTCIKNARKALGDSGGAQRFIRTVRSRGVAFTGEVQRDHAAGAVAPAVDGAARADDEPSLLVLPFRVVDGSEEAAVLADGLGFDLAAVLTRVPLLRLRAPGGAHDDGAVAPSARMLHERSGVDYLLEGSIGQVVDAFRITVRLIDARTGFNLWAERFVVEGGAATASEAALRAVVGKLEPQLHRALYERVRAARAEPSARALYLQASGLLALKGWHHDSFAEAAVLLRTSGELDTGFALAPAHLALVLGVGQRMGLMGDREQACAEALQAAERSLSLDAMNATVLGFSGCALCDIGQLERGVSLLRHAVEVQPANAQAWAALGSACLLQGNLEEAIAHLGHGITISPLDSRLSVWGALLGVAHMKSGDLAAATREARTACQRDDRSYMPRVVLAAALLLGGDEQRSRGALADARRVKPDLDAGQVCALIGRTLGTRLLQDHG